MPLIPVRKPIIDAKFFDELLKNQEKREEAEKKQKELEKELFAELIAEKVVERLKKEKELGLWGR